MIQRAFTNFTRRAHLPTRTPLKHLGLQRFFTLNTEVVQTIPNSKITEFSYGQNSTLHLKMGSTYTNTVIQALWEDLTRVEIEEANPCEIKDAGKDIYITSNEQNSEANARPLRLMIPEYSSLDLEILGNATQEDTQIDAKMKGSLRVKSLDENPGSKIEFRRVKTELSEIELAASDLVFGSYWETKDGYLKKTGPGKVEIKRLGVSFDLSVELDNCDFSAKTSFTNAVESIAEDYQRLQIKANGSNINFGIYRGSAGFQLKDSSLKFSEGNFDGLRVNAENSKVEIYFNEISGKCFFDLKNCDVKFKVNPAIKDRFEAYGIWVVFDGKEDAGYGLEAMKEFGGNQVSVEYQESNENLFGYLMSKYNIDKDKYAGK